MEKASSEQQMSKDPSAQWALRFIVFLGVVSLLCDFTHEGARSIIGPFLSVLGASATVVGVVAGFGELLGYGLRILSGYLTDKTGKYWTILFLGYGMNLVAVPLLALANRWEIAAALILAERMGKALRTPARDAMLSTAARSIGQGWGFGLYKALDQIGALSGPLAVAAVLYFKGSYQFGFAVLLVPAVLALAVLLVARLNYPDPRDLEIKSLHLESKGFPRMFWLYILAVGLIAAGYADFPLIAYHFKKVSIAPDDWIPLFYTVAMAVDGLTAPIFGRLYDRLGYAVLIIGVVFSLFFAPLVFMGGFYSALVGMIFWGVGMGAQESVMKAVVGGMVPMNRLGFAYGVFNTGYGVFWFVGSVLMGVLYDFSLYSLVVFSVAAQLVAIPLLLIAKKAFRAS